MIRLSCPILLTCFTPPVGNQTHFIHQFSLFNSLLIYVCYSAQAKRLRDRWESCGTGPKKDIIFRAENLYQSPQVEVTVCNMRLIQIHILEYLIFTVIPSYLQCKCERLAADLLIKSNIHSGHIILTEFNRLFFSLIFMGDAMVAAS